MSIDSVITEAFNSYIEKKVDEAVQRALKNFESKVTVGEIEDLVTEAVSEVDITRLVEDALNDIDFVDYIDIDDIAEKISGEAPDMDDFVSRAEVKNLLRGLLEEL